jgi:hypothetical protein
LAGPERAQLKRGCLNPGPPGTALSATPHLDPAPFGRCIHGSHSLGSGAQMSGPNGLRAFAISLVMAFHLYSEILPYGYSGMDIFFVLSGYFIIKQIGHPDANPNAFLTLRILRIYPAMVVVITSPCQCQDPSRALRPSEMAAGADVLPRPAAHLLGARGSKCRSFYQGSPIPSAG